MKNLVISCVGDNSLHPKWLEGEKDFDLFLIYYGDQPSRYREQCQYYAEAKGSMVELMSSQIAKHWQAIKHYDAFWLPDDDIDTDAMNINHMFDCFHKYKLTLAQPALTPDSYIAHKILRQRKWSIIRYTNFVEVMVPIMTRKALELSLHSFGLNKTGWGVDFYWNKLMMDNNSGPLAVIDSSAVTHTRPVNITGGYYKAMGLDPKEDMATIMEKYDLSKKHRHYGAVVNFAGRAIKLRWLPHIF